MMIFTRTAVSVADTAWELPAEEGAGRKLLQGAGSWRFRPAWDGGELDDAAVTVAAAAAPADVHVPRRRHMHATWLTEDGIPDVACRARLGRR